MKFVKKCVDVQIKIEGGRGSANMNVRGLGKGIKFWTIFCERHKSMIPLIIYSSCLALLNLDGLNIYTLKIFYRVKCGKTHARVL